MLNWDQVPNVKFGTLTQMLNIGPSPWCWMWEHVPNVESRNKSRTLNMGPFSKCWICDKVPNVESLMLKVGALDKCWIWEQVLKLKVEKVTNVESWKTSLLLNMGKRQNGKSEQV